jgi:hypothetical protein
MGVTTVRKIEKQEEARRSSWRNQNAWSNKTQTGGQRERVAWYFPVRFSSASSSLSGASSLEKYWWISAPPTAH